VSGQWNEETQRYDKVARNAAITLYADYANGANKAWAAATPALQISMVTNGDVESFFEPGGKYTLTFTRDDAPTADASATDESSAVLPDDEQDSDVDEMFTETPELNS
jgi:hypothetical protein